MKTIAQPISATCLSPSESLASSRIWVQPFWNLNCSHARVTLMSLVHIPAHIQIPLIAGAVATSFTAGILLVRKVLSDQTLAEKRVERPRAIRTSLCDSE